MSIGAAIGGAASIFGGLMESSAAGKAAQAQEDAANRDIAFQTETRDLIRKDLLPFLTGGNNALAAYNYEMGLGPQPVFGGAAPAITEIPGARPVIRPAQGNGIPNVWRRNGRMGGGQMQGRRINALAPSRYSVNGQVFGSREEAQAYANANMTGGTAYKGYSYSPDYQFRLEQGNDAVNALAGARGGHLSGRTLEELAQFNQGLAAQGRSEYLSRLGGMVDTGFGAAGMSGNASQNAAAGVSNALSGIGNAQAAGAIGKANAFSNMGNNLIGLWQYQKSLQ